VNSSMTTVGAVLQFIVSGKSIQTMERPAQDGEYGILKVSAVTWGEFRPQQNKAMPADYDPGECPRPMDGDILISRANTRELVGAPVLVRGDYPQLLLSDKILKLIPNRALVDREYLVRALRFPAATAHFFKCAGGSSGSMTNITQGDIRSAPIPLPPLGEQRRIAAILDQAETLRIQRRQALAHLDTLTQSLFLDMFGDPVANPKFQTGTIREFVEANSGKSAKAVLSESLTDVPVYGGNGINGWATAPLYEQPVLVFGRVGQQCGNAFLTEGPSWVTDNAIVVRITDVSRLITKYVLHAFQRSDFSSRVKHLDLPFINQGMILDNPIPLPPIALQEAFATRIQAIEALKATHRTALAQLDALFASLQQRAFAGEL
jgi:type I restriction enzyme S subunit